jgi:crotonobetainyl-CoA:carnitine CoA-transferase CaiB-like acyl-CoA transferase
MFNDLKIVELGTVLAIPSVGTFFAEMGADVLKIEPLEGGDVTRSWKNSREDAGNPVSAYFSSVNYGKRYARADLKRTADLNAVREHCAQADILLVNFKHGDAERYGLDFDTLKSINPRLIYGHLTGFRSTPERVAYDTVLQAETGFMHMNGYPDSLPAKMPVALIDVLGAHQMKEGLLVALLQREKTGKGGKVSVTLEESALSSLINQASNYLMTGMNPGRSGTLHPNIAPYGEMFQTSDGPLIVLAVGSNRQFETLVRILNRPHLADDDRFRGNVQRVQNREALAAELSTAFRQHASTVLMEQFIAQDVPAGVVKDLSAVFQSDLARDMVLRETVEGQQTERMRSVVFRITE